MAFVNMSESVTKYILQMFVMTMRNVKKNIVTKGITLNVTFLTSMEDVNLESTESKLKRDIDCLYSEIADLKDKTKNFYIRYLFWKILVTQKM